MTANRPQPAEPLDVGRYYDEWTERYLDSFGDSIQAHRPQDEADLHDYLFQRIGLRDGKRVLDAGCGVCGPARAFARRANLEIDALTVSPRQVEIAQRKNEESGLSSRIRVRRGDFHQLVEIFGREAFDTIYYLESLSHSPRPAAALAAAYEALKPGGCVYIKDFFVRPCADPAEQRRILEVIERVDRMFAVKTAWAKDIEEALRSAGFLPIFVEQPRFDVDNGRWQHFESRHRIDLFAGGSSFDWSEWLEFKFQKP